MSFLIAIVVYCTPCITRRERIITEAFIMFSFCIVDEYCSEMESFKVFAFHSCFFLLGVQFIRDLMTLFIVVSFRLAAISRLPIVLQSLTLVYNITNKLFLTYIFCFMSLRREMEYKNGKET